MSCRVFCMFFISTVYFGTSGFLIYVSSWLIHSYREGNFQHNDIIAINAQVPDIILLSMSCVIFLVSIIGCCGTACDNKIFKIIFCTLSICALVVLLFSGFAGVLCKMKAHDDIEDAFHKAVVKYNNTEDGSDKTVDFIQNKVKCCGIESPSDWINSTYWFRTQFHNNVSGTHFLPESCCEDKSTICKLNEGNFYNKGCLKPILHDLKKHLIYGFGFCFGFAVLLAFGALISCIKCKCGVFCDKKTSVKKYTNIYGGTYA